ncbi:MAG: hypothetical protein CL915_03090 [Deltaproteobacteria bacterium]|nr:hypothetical protein [Deltaproteobacteria bacterium]
MGVITHFQISIRLMLKNFSLFSILFSLFESDQLYKSFLNFILMFIGLTGNRHFYLLLVNFQGRRNL